jgi:hypothetical protein
MKRLLVALAFLAVCAGASFGQKGKAEFDLYPLGYPGDIWTGEVAAFDNEHRTLTLTHGSGKKAETFIATIPDAPYEWVRDMRKERVLDFPYDKKATSQVFRLGRPSSAEPARANVGERAANGLLRRPNPPDSSRITDFADFKGRLVMVYYTQRERKTADGSSEKYNDVWRVRIFSEKKK